MIFTPVQWYARAIDFGEVGVVARDEKKRFAVRCGQNGVNAVVAAGLDRAKQFNFVELIIAVRVGNAVNAARDFSLVVIHTDVKRAEGPQQSVRSADLRGHLFDLRGIEWLSRGG